MDCETLVKIGTIELPKSELEGRRKLWADGVLAPIWAEQFPQLFELDSEWAMGPQPTGGYGFWEFLAAIILYQATGYRSLWSRFPKEPMPEKRQLVDKLSVDQQRSLLPILDDSGPHKGTQVPDLLMYAKDYSDWFFCEVKGPKDSVSQEQCDKWNDLAAITGKSIRLLEFKER